MDYFTNSLPVWRDTDKGKCGLLISAPCKSFISFPENTQCHTSCDPVSDVCVCLFQFHVDGIKNRSIPKSTSQEASPRLLILDYILIIHSISLFTPLFQDQQLRVFHWILMLPFPGPLELHVPVFLGRGPIPGRNGNPHSAQYHVSSYVGHKKSFPSCPTGIAPLPLINMDEAQTTHCTQSSQHEFFFL